MMEQAKQEDEAVRTLVLQLAKMLIDESDAVEVFVLEDNDVVTIRVTAEGDVIAKIVGKQGHTAKSLRTIVMAAGMKFERRYTLSIEEAS